MEKNKASSLCYPGPSFDVKEVLAQATAHRKKNHARPNGVKQVMHNVKVRKKVSFSRKPPLENNGPSLVL